MLPLDKHGSNALDHLIQKFLPVAGKIIITTAYHTDFLEDHIRKKYNNPNIVFSREKVNELKSPGRSVLFALDHCVLTNPTIVMFSDFIFEDYIPVDQDALVINAAPETDYHIVDAHAKGEPVVEEGVVKEVRPRKDPGNPWYGGFTGMGIFHNTVLFKALTYKYAVQKPDFNINYDFDVVNDYVKQVKTIAVPVNHLFEFGVPDMLKKVRDYTNSNNS